MGGVRPMADGTVTNGSDRPTAGNGSDEMPAPKRAFAACSKLFDASGTQPWHEERCTSLDMSIEPKRRFCRPTIS